MTPMLSPPNPPNPLNPLSPFSPNNCTGGFIVAIFSGMAKGACWDWTEVTEVKLVLDGVEVVGSRVNVLCNSMLQKKTGRETVLDTGRTTYHVQVKFKNYKMSHERWKLSRLQRAYNNYHAIETISRQEVLCLYLIILTILATEIFWADLFNFFSCKFIHFFPQN